MALGVGVDPQVLSTTSPHIRQVLPTEYPPSPPAPDVMEPKEEQPPMPSGQKRLSKERKPQVEEEEPATKRQSRDHEDGPLSLVMPKVSGRQTRTDSPLTRFLPN